MNDDRITADDCLRRIRELRDLLEGRKGAADTATLRNWLTDTADALGALAEDTEWLHANILEDYARDMGVSEDKAADWLDYPAQRATWGMSR